MNKAIQGVEKRTSIYDINKTSHFMGLFPSCLCVYFILKSGAKCKRHPKTKTAKIIGILRNAMYFRHLSKNVSKYNFLMIRTCIFENLHLQNHLQIFAVLSAVVRIESTVYNCEIHGKNPFSMTVSSDIIYIFDDGSGKVVQLY